MLFRTSYALRFLDVDSAVDSFCFRGYNDAEEIKDQAIALPSRSHGHEPMTIKVNEHWPHHPVTRRE